MDNDCLNNNQYSVCNNNIKNKSVNTALLTCFIYERE